MITQSEKKIVGWNGHQIVILIELINNKWITTFHANPFNKGNDIALEVLSIQQEALKTAANVVTSEAADKMWERHGRLVQMGNGGKDWEDE